MTYQNIVPGRFLSRPNRFIAHVEVDGGAVASHVKNTGRCRELLVPGARVYLDRSDNPSRKTAYSLVAVEKGERLINMDSQAPNQVVAEALAAGWRPEGLAGELTDVRREFTHGGSRFDFRLDVGSLPTLMEVKGVTLEEGGKVLFPDAPTERGVKHIQHLIRAREEGMGAWIVFVIQMADVDSFSPNDRTHKAFGDALRAARAAGVGICAHTCAVAPDSLSLSGPVPVDLGAQPQRSDNG